MALEKELATYRRELPNLLQHAGKFAVISVDSVLGVFDTYEDALQAGYDKCKLNPFMIKQIQAVEQVLTFTRDLTACHT